MATSHATIQVAAAMPARGSRTNSTATRAAEAAPAAAPIGAATTVGVPTWRRRAETTAPAATNAPCASDGQPADADGECEPGRCEREVETACEVGEP